MKKVILAAALAGGALWACHEAGRPGLVEGAGSEEIFIKRVMGDTVTSSQDLTWDAARAGVDYVESPDGSIRVYRWISGGGTCAFWTTVTQYRDTKGRVRCFYGLPLFGNDSLLTVTDILMADRPGKPPVYLFCFYCKASSTEGYNDLYPAVLQTDTFALGRSLSGTAKQRNPWASVMIFPIGISVPMTGRGGSGCVPTFRTGSGSMCRWPMRI